MQTNKRTISALALITLAFTLAFAGAQGLLIERQASDNPGRWMWVSDNDTHLHNETQPNDENHDYDHAENHEENHNHEITSTFEEYGLNHLEDPIKTQQQQEEQQRQAQLQTNLENARNTLLEQHDYANAETQYQNILIEHHTNLEAHNGLAKARYAQNNWHGASTALKHALANHPNHPALTYNLALAQIRQGSYTQATQTLSRLIEHLEDQPRTAEAIALTHTLLGHTYLLAGKTTEAAMEFTTAHNAQPSSETQYLQLAAQALGEDPFAALPGILDAANTAAEHRFSLLAAELLLKENDKNSAEAHIQRVLQDENSSNEEQAEALYLLATLSADSYTALTLYEQAHNRNPSIWQAAYNAAIIHTQNHNPHAALQLISAINSAEHPVLLSLQARLQLLNHDPHTAHHIATQALELNDNNYDRLTAAYAAYQLGNHDDALTRLSNMPDEHGEDAYAITSLTGIAAYELGNYTVAAEAFQTAFNESLDSEIRRNLISAQLAAGKHQEALGHLIQLTNDNPNDGILMQQLGWAHRYIGNTVESQLAFRRATALGAPSN